MGLTVSSHIFKVNFRDHRGSILFNEVDFRLEDLHKSVVRLNHLLLVFWLDQGFLENRESLVQQRSAAGVNGNKLSDNENSYSICFSLTSSIVGRVRKVRDLIQNCREKDLQDCDI